MSRREEGYTLVELMVTFAVLAVVATAAIGVAMRAFTDTGTIMDRRDVFADGRVALDRLTKQLRQAESIDEVFSKPSKIRFRSYLNGQPATFVWKVSGASAPYRLEESRDDGGTFATIVSSLASSSVFTYTPHGSTLDQVTIRLGLATKTTTVELTSDVHIRNA